METKEKNRGYSKIFRKPIVYQNKPAPLDLFEVKGNPKNKFWRSFKDAWINFGRNIAKGTRKIGEWLHVVKKQEKNKLDFNQYIENAQVEDVFGTPTKVAAEIEDVYLTFRNPADPKEKNLVLRGPSLKIYEGKVHAIIGESGSGKSVITSLLYGLTGSNAIIESGKIKLYGLEVQDYTM